MTTTQDTHPLGARRRIEHDGFEGRVIGYYTRRDGKEGVVLQQEGTNVVHVYGTKWLLPVDWRHNVV